MEFMATSRLIDTSAATVPPYSALKGLEPVLLTSDLDLVENPDNLGLLQRYADSGQALTPIRRLPCQGTSVDRSAIDFPRRVLMEMTSKCNLLCTMCPQQNLTRPLVHMDKDLYMRCIDELDAHGIEGVWLYHFGESLLHPDFREILAHVSTKERLGKIWLSTNGLLLNEENASAILSSKLDYLNFSLQGITAEVYEKITTKSTYEVARRNLDRFMKLKKDSGRKTPVLRLQIIDQDLSRGQIDDFLGNFYQDAEIVSVNQLEHTNIPGNRSGKTARQRDELKRCGRIDRGDCFVNSSGSVTLCDEAYNDQILLGYVQEQTIEKIWNGDERRRYLELNAAGRIRDISVCAQCSDYDL